MGLTKDRVRNIILAILVILSFLLSYLLWTAGRAVDVEDISTGQFTRSNVAVNPHSASDTFRPALVTVHGLNAQTPTMLSHTYPLKNFIEYEYNQTNLERIERVESMTVSEYLSLLQSSRWLEFVYYEELPIGIIQQKFEELSREEANQFFDRMLVNLDSPNTVFLYHSDSSRLYEISISNNVELDIEPFINQENLNYVEAFPLVLDNNIVYLPSAPLDLPIKSYVIDQFPNSVYINSFFPDTSLVDVRSAEELTRYIDLTKEVTINDLTNTLSFVRQISNPSDLEPSTRFTRSFDQINRFENWSQTFILSGYDRETETISFRREIDGIPVFSRQGYEALSSISLVESGVTNLSLPLRFISTPISIPISDDEGSVQTLISGRELIDNVNTARNIELPQRISNIVLGYTWEESQEDNQVVNFIPEWYLLIEDYWISYENFMTLQSEETAYGL